MDVWWAPIQGADASDVFRASKLIYIVTYCQYGRPLYSTSYVLSGLLTVSFHQQQLLKPLQFCLDLKCILIYYDALS